MAAMRRHVAKFILERPYVPLDSHSEVSFLMGLTCSELSERYITYIIASTFFSSTCFYEHPNFIFSHSKLITEAVFQAFY